MSIELVNWSVKTHFTNVDKSSNRSPSKAESYIKVSKKENVPVVFSENGNIYDWVAKRELLHKSDMKYVHSNSFSITDKASTDSIANTYVNLIAKNLSGVREINKLTTLSYQGREVADKKDNEIHYYYVPRLTFDEVMNTTDNVIVLFYGINNPIWIAERSNFAEQKSMWNEYIRNNKDKVWLGISSHSHGEYKAMTQYFMNEYSDMNMLFVNDIYAHDYEYEHLRHLLNKEQNPNYETDNIYKGWFTVNEVKNSFKQQGIVRANTVDMLLENTVKLYDTIEEFDLDMKNAKYPKLFDDNIQAIKDKVKEGYANRGLDKLSKEEQEPYQRQILEELNVMQKTGSIDYMLLEQYVKDNMAKEGRYPAPGRGSSGGSTVAWLLNITDINPLKHELLFERFMNKDRISLADIDSDWTNQDRERVQQFLLTHNKLDCAAVITYGTFGVKSAINAIGRGMGYDDKEISSITVALPNNADFEDVPRLAFEKYPDLMERAKMIKGVVTSVGRHASAILVSDLNLEEYIGTTMVKGFDYPVTTINMELVEKMKMVKLDVLGLSTLGWSHEAIKLADIPRIHSQSEHIDWNDWSIRDDILDNGTLTIFQLEEQEHAIQKIMSDESLARIRETSPDITVIDLISITTAVIRPGSASIMSDVLNGISRDYDIPEIDEILSDSFGHVIYQEQTINLIKYAGFSGSQADIIRRAIGHKDAEVINNWIPEFKETLVNKIMSDYPTKDKEEVIETVDGLAQIIIDSSAYSFNKSHAVAYSYISYETAWLRKYYPLEWLTAGFIIWRNSLDKVNTLTKLADKLNISINPVKFRYSRGDYFMDTENNDIYEGTGAIKGNNIKVGDQLYTLRDRDYKSFTDLLVDIHDDFSLSVNGKEYDKFSVLSMNEDEVKALDKDIKDARKENQDNVVETSDKLSINKTQMLSLIRLDYFSEFGGGKKLEKIYDMFKKDYKPNNKTYKNKALKYQDVLAFEQSAEDEQYNIYETCDNQMQYLERVTIHDESIPPQFAFVVSVDKETKSYTMLTIHNINKGVTVTAKVPVKMYRNVPTKGGDIVQVIESETKGKVVRTADGWKTSDTEKELWLNSIKYIRNTNRK